VAAAALLVLVAVGLALLLARGGGPPAPLAREAPAASPLAFDLHDATTPPVEGNAAILDAPLPLQEAPTVSAPAPPAAEAGIRGRVLDGATREPVARFEVRCAEATPNPVILYATSRRFEDPEGRFEIPGLPPARYGLEVLAEGYALERVGPIEVRAEATDDVVEVLLDRGAEILARIVRASDGSPVGDATVVLRPDSRYSTLVLRNSTPHLLHEARSAAEDGFVRLPGVPEGSFRVEVAHPDLLGRTTPSFAVERGSVVDLGEIRLFAGGTVEGTIRNRDGEGVPGARLLLVGPDARRRTLSGPTGTYAFTALPPGRYSIVVERLPGPEVGLLPAFPEQAFELGEGATVRVDL